MNKLKDFKKYRYLAVIKDCRLEYFDLESNSTKYTDYVVGDIVRAEDFDLRFNAELTIKDLNVSSRSFKMFFVDFLNHYFMPYQPKFEIGDIIVNHDSIYVREDGFLSFERGTLFKVIEPRYCNEYQICVKPLNSSKDDESYRFNSYCFEMYNPKVYMR